MLMDGPSTSHSHNHNTMMDSCTSSCSKGSIMLYSTKKRWSSSSHNIMAIAITVLAAAATTSISSTDAFLTPRPLSRICNHQNRQTTSIISRLQYTNTTDNNDSNTALIDSNVVVANTEQPTSSSKNERTTTTTKQKTDYSRSRSAKRLLKAQRLLEMAQISPSQRLEIEEARKASSTMINNGNNNSTSTANSNNNNVIDNNNNNMMDTVVPMGSYSMRFGGYGTLEEELKDMYKMRMADTFDSLDNVVDENSLLPGGRWVYEDKDGATGETKAGYSSTSSAAAAISKATELPSLNVAEPLVPYDPIAAEKILFRQPTKWLVRNVQIAVPFGTWVTGVLIDTIFGKSKQNRRNRAKQLNNIIADLGPAIIKAGQALASRPDLLPSEYLDELQQLQDNVPTFKNEVAFQIVEEELNLKFEEVFELVEPEPIAAASIGQVYKARLLKNGQLVALKIQRPNTEEVVALDLYVLRWWGGVYNKIFELLGRNINLQSVMDDFGNLLYAEIDYVAEAANARRFSELYAQDVAIADVFVPKVYSELTSRKVLTMEWVDGFRLTDSASLEANNLDRKKLVDTLVQCSLRQIMENGFFHADPHAGNLLATKDGRLCYLDFGMMSYAAAKQRNGFLLAVVHIVNRDWSALVKVYQNLGFIPEGTDVQPIENALEDALPDVLNSDISELNFKNVVGKLGDIMYTYPFSLPPFYISIIRCLGVLEGLAIQVDPKSRIISKAYPYVANRVLTDDSQKELREALRRLIFTSDGSIRWSRLESLLDEAKDSSGFDVVPVLDRLIDYAISSEGEELLNEIADQIVKEADSLGRDTLIYFTQAATALSIRDEKSAAKAIQSLVHAVQNNKDETNEKDVGAEKESKMPTPVASFLDSLREDLAESLPEPTESMKRTMKLGLLLGTRGASSLATTTSRGNAASATASTISKFTPLVRKLSQEPRVRQKAGEIVARLSERLVSRGLRAAFSLPPPEFETTVVDDDNKK